MDFQTMMPLLISILPNILYLLVLKALDSFALARFSLVIRNMLIEYLTGARNSFLDKNIPTDDVDNAILSLLKLRKKRKAKLGL